MLNDPEHVEMILDAQERFGLKPEGPSKPAMSEYTPEAARLDSVIDRLGTITTVLLRANGAKSVPKQTLQPRPETVVDELEHRRRVQKSKSIADRAMRRTPSA